MYIITQFKFIPSYNSFTPDIDLTNYENQTMYYNSKYNNKVIRSMHPL